MNINELRINNLISHNGLFCTVEIINGELDEIYFLGEDFYYSDKPENLEGVPLTEKWIKDLGLIKVNGWDYMIYWRLPENKNSNDCFELMETLQGYELPSGKICEFVDQLQNCYFFHELTGKELTSTKANYNTKMPMKPKEYCQCDFPLIRNGEYCGICGLDLEKLTLKK